MDRIKFKDDVDLDVILTGFVNNENAYDLSSPFDEFISVDKKTRHIIECGYNGLVADWIKQGLLETY